MEGAHTFQGCSQLAGRCSKARWTCCRTGSAIEIHHDEIYNQIVPVLCTLSHTPHTSTHFLPTHLPDFDHFCLKQASIYFPYHLNLPRKLAMSGHKSSSHKSSSHKSSSHKSSSHKPSKGKSGNPEGSYTQEYFWDCCQCDNSKGLGLESTPSCPEFNCRHTRCATCPGDWYKIYNHRWNGRFIISNLLFVFKLTKLYSSQYELFVWCIYGSWFSTSRWQFHNSDWSIIYIRFLCSDETIWTLGVSRSA